MDGIAGAASGLSSAQVASSVGVKVQKEAQDMAKGQAAQMLNSIPQAPNMAHQGQNFNGIA